MSTTTPRSAWYTLANTNAEISVEIGEGLLRVGSAEKRLEPRIAGVLALLVQRGGEPVTRDEFLDTVWDEDGSDEALTQAISRLRQLLGDRALIKTLPRIGYQLTVTPQALDGAPAQAPAAPPMPVIAIPKTYLYGLLSGAALVMAVLAMTLVFAGPSGETSQSVELEIEEGPEIEFHRIPDDG